jgi:hypothetical protein
MVPGRYGAPEASLELAESSAPVGKVSRLNVK